jgi:hypothetical protein
VPAPPEADFFFCLDVHREGGASSRSRVVSPRWRSGMRTLWTRLGQRTSVGQFSGTSRNCCAMSRQSGYDLGCSAFRRVFISERRPGGGRLREAAWQSSIGNCANSRGTSAICSVLPSFEWSGAEVTRWPAEVDGMKGGGKGPGDAAGMASHNNRVPPPLATLAPENMAL